MWQPEKLATAMASREYETKTRGTRRLEPTRALGEGCVTLCILRCCVIDEHRISHGSRGRIKKLDLKLQLVPH
jgi:hypothetical protein